jgi:hypothetical protein
VLLAALPALASASGTRPEPGHTGGFGEPTCHACHFDRPLDDGEGTLRVEGLPDAPRPGETYRLRVALERPGLRRGGFEIAVRFAAGPARGRSAGILRPIDGRVEVTRVEEARVDYAHHGPAGTVAEPPGEPPGEIAWQLDWTAPLEPERLLLHAAANAANDDDSELGDRVYTRESAIVFERQSLPDQDGSSADGTRRRSAAPTDRI